MRAPLTARRIKSAPYDPEASFELTVSEAMVEYQPAKGGRPPVIWLNRQAQAVLTTMLGHPSYVDKHGLVLLPEHSEIAVQSLKEVAANRGLPEKARSAASRLGRVIRNAAEGERHVAIVQAGPEMTREEIQAAYEEELDHIEGLKLSGGLAGLLAVEELPVEFEIAQAALVVSGYPDDLDYLVHETLVRLMRPGRYVELRLKRGEAQKLARAYGTLLHRTHGQKAEPLANRIYGAAGIQGEADDAGRPAHITRELPPPDRRRTGRRRSPPGRIGPPLSAAGRTTQGKLNATLTARLHIPEPKAEFALRELARRMGFALRFTAGDAGDLFYGPAPHPGFSVHLPSNAPNPIESTWRLLSYAEEASVPDAARDRRGVFLTSALPPERQRTAAEPLIEQYAARLREQFPGHQSAPRWPSGKKYALVMTHDVDAIDAGAPLELATALAKRNWALLREGLRGNPWFQFRWWRDWEKSIGIRSAFYFYIRSRGVRFDRNDCKSGVARLKTADWDLFRAMADEGWEFGVHASIHTKDTPGGFTAAREWLEQRLGRPVAGIRHHYFALDWRNPSRTHGQHAEAGFEYDSSIAWRDMAGFRTGTSLPHHAYGAENLMILPCSLMDNHVTCSDVKGTRVATDVAVERALAMVRRVKQTGGALVFNWHQETAANRLMYTGYRNVIEKIAEACFGDTDAWIVTPRQLCRYWKKLTAES